MTKKEHIVRYSDKKLRTIKSRTDWRRVNAMAQADVERLADEEDGPLPKGWESGIVLGLPPGKEAIKLRIDRDVLDWFRATGQGYQTRINNVLRAFVASRGEAKPAAHKPR